MMDGPGALWLVYSGYLSALDSNVGQEGTKREGGGVGLGQRCAALL